MALLSGAQLGKCLPAGEKVILGDGRRIPIESISIGDEVLSLGDDLKIIGNRVIATFNNGIQAIYRIVTCSGRSIVVTAEHPLYSHTGWLEAGKFSPGDFIGVPRRLGNLGKGIYDKKLLRLMGYLLGDGGLTGTVSFSNIDPVVLADVADCLPDTCEMVHEDRCTWRIRGRGKNRKAKNGNTVLGLVRQWGIDKLSKQKHIPEFVFGLTNTCIAEVLNGLFACDSWVDTKGWGIGLASEEMINDIQHLLLRFGILTRKRYKPVKLNGRIFDSWALHTNDWNSLVAIHDEIGIVGKREKLAALISRKEYLRKNTKDLVADFDIGKCWDALGPLSGGQRIGYKDQLGYNLLRSCRRKNVARPQAQLLAEHFGVQREQAFSDIYWDKIDSIEYIGEEAVYDIAVENGHNFIANDIFAHNTGLVPWWLKREIEHRGSGDYLAVTSSFPLFDKKFLPQMLLVFESILGWGRFWAGAQIIELKDPQTGEFLARRVTDPMWGRIILGSAQSSGGLESATAKAAVLDEAGQEEFTLQAWRAIRTRRVAINRGRILITSTLYSLGWLLPEIIQPALKNGQTTTYDLANGASIDFTDDAVDDIALIQADSIVNPAFPKEEYDAAEKTMPPDEFSMFFRGRAAKPRHLIYDCLNDDLHIIPPFKIPDDWQRYMGLDFGGVNTIATFWAEEPKSRKLYCYREYRAGGRSAKEHVEEMLWGEPMAPLCYGGAPAEGQWRQEFRDGGLSVKQPKISDVWVGINICYAEIKANNIFIFDTCTGLRNDLSNYRKKYDDNGNPTDEIFDKNRWHYADSFRVLISSIRKHRYAMIGFA